MTINKIIYSILLLGCFTLQAQVKVGNNLANTNATAAFEVESITKGFLPPRMTTGERDLIASPAKGLVLYNLTLDCLQVNKGTPASPNWECIGASAAPVGTQKSCKEIKDANPLAADGVYTIDPDGVSTVFSDMQAQCDMTTDGGGWTMVLNYVRPANDITNVNVRTTFPLLGSSTLGANETSSPTLWGHAGNTLLNNFTFTDVRFFGITSGHSRVTHFKTTLGVSYIKTGTGSFDGVNSNFTPLSGHTANNPALATDEFGDQGNLALTKFPFFKGALGHWACGANQDASNRWEVDDFPTGPQNSTIHRVWVR